MTHGCTHNIRIVFQIYSCMKIFRDIDGSMTVSILFIDKALCNLCKLFVRVL